MRTISWEDAYVFLEKDATFMCNDVREDIRVFVASFEWCTVAIRLHQNGRVERVELVDVIDDVCRCSPASYRGYFGSVDGVSKSIEQVFCENAYILYNDSLPYEDWGKLCGLSDMVDRVAGRGVGKGLELVGVWYRSGHKHGSQPKFDTKVEEASVYFRKGKEVGFVKVQRPYGERARVVGDPGGPDVERFKDLIGWKR